MGELDLAAIQARADAATPGPWLAFGDTLASFGGAHNCAGGIPESGYVHEAYCGYEPMVFRLAHADAEFIAHARTDVPALLARVAELEAERDEKQEARVDLEGQRRAARNEVARLVRDGTNRGYLLAGWALTRLEHILGLSLTHARLFEFADAPDGFVSPTAAEARGRQWAIDALRDRGFNGAADYLAAQPDHSGG